MMYLNATLKAGPYARTVLAHEYMHAIAYTLKCSRRASPGEPCVEEEGWLDEAIAHLVEDLHGFSTANLDYRVSAFLSWPESYRLVVDDYFAADLFRSHGNRGSTYLFLKWCVDRYGPRLIPALVHSTKRGVANLEAATGSTFADLYRRWSLALYLSGMGPTPESSATSGDGFVSTNLRAPMADWELAGPRSTQMVPGGPDEHWNATGTSSHFVVIDGTTAGAVEVEVVGPPTARLQVTALPLGTDRPRLALSLHSSTGPDGSIRIQAKVAERGGVSVRLSALAWEPLVPGPCPQSKGFRAGRLDMLGIASTFGTSAVPGGGAIVSRPIPLAGIPRDRSDGREGHRDRRPGTSRQRLGRSEPTLGGVRLSALRPDALMRGLLPRIWSSLNGNRTTGRATWFQSFLTSASRTSPGRASSSGLS